MKLLGLVLSAAVLSCGGTQPCPPTPPAISTSEPDPALTPTSSDLDSGFTGFGVLWGHKCVQVTIDAPTTGGRGTIRARDGAGTAVELAYVVDGGGADVSAVHFPTDKGARASIACSSQLTMNQAVRLDGVPLHATYAQCQQSRANPPNERQRETEVPSCWDAVGDALIYARHTSSELALANLDKAPREWITRLRFGASFFNADDGCHRWRLVAHDLLRGQITREENVDGVPTRIAREYWVNIEDAGALSIQLSGRVDTKYGKGGWAGFSATSGIGQKRAVSPSAAHTLGVDGWFTTQQRCEGDRRR